MSKLVGLLNDSIKDTYGKNSPYDGRGSSFSFGFRQPYVWTSLRDSNFKKYLKRYDSRGFPIGSSLRDTERMIKFTLSGRGIWWVLKQQFLHIQSPHDETNIVDPSSHIVSALRPTTFGLIPRVTKHVSGGSLIGKIVSLLTGGEPEHPNLRFWVKIRQRDRENTLPNTLISGLGDYGLLRGQTANCCER